MSSLIKSNGITPQASVTLNKKSESDHVSNDLAQNINLTKRQTEIDAELLLAKKMATDQGYAEGKKAAEEEIEKISQDLYRKYNEQELALRENYSALEQNLLTVSVQLKKHNDELAKAFEARLLLLTMECLYKLTGNKNIYESIVEENIRRCLSQESYSDKICIRLPEASAAQFAFLADTARDNCVVVFEQGLEPGICLITSGYTTEDVSLLTLLEQVKDQFLSIYNTKQTNA